MLEKTTYKGKNNPLNKKTPPEKIIKFYEQKLKEGKGNARQRKKWEKIINKKKGLLSALDGKIEELKGGSTETPSPDRDEISPERKILTLQQIKQLIENSTDDSFSLVHALTRLNVKIDDELLEILIDYHLDIQNKKPTSSTFSFLHALQENGVKVDDSIKNKVNEEE